MVIKNGQSPARKRQPKAVPSSSKPKRSNSVPKNPVFADNSQAANELEGNFVCAQGGALEGETGDRILEEAGTTEGARGNDLSNIPTELTAITVHQPHASLIAKEIKVYETRDWATTYRGLMAIHAGKKQNNSTLELLQLAEVNDISELPAGAVIGIGKLTDCILMTKEFIAAQSERELACGDWKPGRYAWKFENVRAIEPISATGKQGLWKWKIDAENVKSDECTEEGKTKAAEFGVTIEPPDPNDYEFPEQFEEDYKNWVATQPEEELANFKEVETWNQLMDGSICVQELGPASPTPESNCGEKAPTSSANGTTTASDFSKSDSLEQSNLPISNSLTLSAKSPSLINQESSQLPPPASPLAMMGSDSQQTIIETVSPTYSEESKTCNPTSQLLKTSEDSSTVPTPPATNQEVTLDLSSTAYTRSGSMSNGKLSAAPTLPAPGVESESLLLRSPGALSGGENSRPPGKSRLETQLNQLGLIQDGEVVAPEFLEAGYQLPIGWTNLQENRTALELSQVQAQQSSIVPKSELPAETATTETDEKHSGTHLTGGLLLSDSSELNISVTLPPNIGALSKSDLIGMAKEQHQLICVIERKEFELALEKLHRFRLTGVYLQEFKKKCQYGEFEKQLEQAGIGIRSAQSYMVIAKNWDVVESKAKLVALLTEENQPAIGLKWALESVRDEKKQLKSAAPPKDPDNWKTPENKEQPIVSLVKKALGGTIYLDPCSDSGCNIPATMRYFKWNDGLAKHNIWEKTIFVNPPFSDPFPWVERCCLEIARGSVSAAIMLLKAGVVSNTGTGELIKKYASALCHWTGRINFLNDEGNPIKGSNFDCVFLYFGTRFDLFRDAFGGRGTIATIENHYSSINRKYLLKSEIPEFGNTQAEQKQLAAAVGLGNGKSVLPDMRDADRERNERYDPHTVVDVLSSSMPTTPAKPVPVSENLVEPLAEPEIFDETPLATRQFETAKQNTLNDYIIAISSNLSDFSDEQIAFLTKIINEESVKRIGF